MAVQADYNFRGTVIKGAYVRIDNVSGNKITGWHGLASVYPNAAAADEAVVLASNPDKYGAPPTNIMTCANHLIIDAITVNAPYNAKRTNALALLYEALMTHPSFSNVVMV